MLQISKSKENVLNSAKTAQPEKFIKIIRDCLSSRLYPYFAAAVMLLCYFLGGDIYAIYFIAVSAMLMLLFLDDLTPGISIFLFMTVIVSLKNTPSGYAESSGYYYQPVIYIQIIVIISLLVATCIFRIFKTFAQKKFKPDPVFISLCALAAVFILNGVFFEGYTTKNLLYGLFCAATYLIIFTLIKNNVNCRRKSFELIAHAFLAFSILLIAELIGAYLSYDNIYVDGIINRNLLFFGWGVYNTMGLLLLLCIPPVIYLASLYKHGYLLTVYSLALVVACMFSLSRQTMLGLVIIYPLCLVMLFRRRGYRLINGLIIAAAAIAFALVVALRWGEISNIISQIFSNFVIDGKLDGSGRMTLFRLAIEDFLKAPVFGVGFYSPSINDAVTNLTGLEVIPVFYHNTVLQMLGSCGFVGLIVYTVHRVLTVFSYCGNPTFERTFVAVTILVILFLSLLDVHMFDILPPMLYSYLLAILVATEKKPEKEPSLIKLVNRPIL